MGMSSLQAITVLFVYVAAATVSKVDCSREARGAGGGGGRTARGGRGGGAGAAGRLRMAQTTHAELDFERAIRGRGQPVHHVLRALEEARGEGGRGV